MASARSRSTKILRERVIPTPYDCVRACRRETRARAHLLFSRVSRRGKCFTLCGEGYYGTENFQVSYEAFFASP